MAHVTLRIVSASLPAQSVEASVEAELFDEIRRGELGWQKRAFEEYYGLVHGLVLKSLGPHSDVEDLVSDVFVRFFESAGRVRSASGLRSYLVSVAMNAVRHEVRRNKRRALYQSLFGAKDEVERRAAADNPEAKAALIHLSRILNELSANDRAAFVLHNLEAMPLTEIAQVLDISHSTAKRRVKRATTRVMKRVSRNALLADYLRERTEKRHG